MAGFEKNPCAKVKFTQPLSSALQFSVALWFLTLGSAPNCFCALVSTTYLPFAAFEPSLRDSAAFVLVFVFSGTLPPHR